MPLLPRRRVRTGVICSASDVAIGIPRSIGTVSPTTGADDSKGRRCGAPWIDTATAQSIFQAEKITLGTAGSPVGYL